MKNLKKISPFQYITQDIENGPSHADLAESACKGGADWIQLRVKNISGDLLNNLAWEVKNICSKYGAALIINDHVMLARDIQTHGVHLGSEDMDPVTARKILGEEFIIGATANTIHDLERLSTLPVDYIGIGPFRFTRTKSKLSPVMGLNGIKTIIGQSENLSFHKPLIAIGGIRLDDVEEIMNTGVHGVAVSSAINFSGNRSEMTSQFIKAINRYINV